MNEIAQNRDKLIDLGFERIESGSDSVRTVWFRRYLYSIKEINFYIEAEFELFIADDPYVSYTDNLQYSFENLYIIATDKDLEGFNSGYSTVHAKEPLSISTFRELKRLLKATETLSSFL